MVFGGGYEMFFGPVALIGRAVDSKSIACRFESYPTRRTDNGPIALRLATDWEAATGSQAEIRQYPDSLERQAIWAGSSVSAGNSGVE